GTTISPSAFGSTPVTAVSPRASVSGIVRTVSSRAAVSAIVRTVSSRASVSTAVTPTSPPAFRSTAVTAISPPASLSGAVTTVSSRAPVPAGGTESGAAAAPSRPLLPAAGPGPAAGGLSGPAVRTRTVCSIPATIGRERGLPKRGGGSGGGNRPGDG